MPAEKLDLDPQHGRDRHHALARRPGPKAVQLAPQPFAGEAEADLAGIGEIAVTLFRDKQRFETAFADIAPKG